MEALGIKLLPPTFEPWDPLGEKQVTVLMSSGVDSSVTAYLLKNQGWNVLGITMKIPVACSAPRGCCGTDAAFVCEQLGIAHYFIDVIEPFRKHIIEPFQQAYASGITPNPCIDCNTILKFSVVWDFIRKQFGIEYLATGHYAVVNNLDEQFRLSCADDALKDQSYFLYGISAQRLRNFMLPLGGLTKIQVRNIAKEANLCVAEKPESMELCFAGEGDYRQALADANSLGNLLDMQGNKIGTHKGIANYTIGQRRGLGFAGGKPLYVSKIDPYENTVSLGTREQLCLKIVCAKDINVLIPDEFAVGKRLSGKIRSYADRRLCKIIEVDNNNLRVEFDEPIFAPCPGQKLVLYNSFLQVVAGGTIVKKKF